MEKLGFGVKYSLNRDKDDIYVTHSSNTEEIPDDENVIIDM